MNWPGPDTGHTSIPGPDTGIARLPGPDRATVAFPPPPMPVVFISAAVVADMRASATTGWIPWENADVVADMNAAVDITTSTATLAEIVADMNAAGVFVVDDIDLPVDAAMTARVVVVPAAVIEARVQLDASAGIAGKPVAVIFADVNTSMDANASVTVQGFTTAKVISDMTAAGVIVPSPSIAALITADMTASGVITSGPVVSAFTTGSGLQNWTVTLPPAATGDLRVIVVGLVAKSTNSISGWTKLGEDSSWYDPGIAVYYRIRRALDPDTVTLNNGGYGSASTVVAMTIPGAMIPTIFGTAKNYSSTAPSPHTTPAITTTKAYNLAIRAVVGNPATPSAPTYSGWGAPMAELAQVQSVPADSAGDNSVMTVATGSASVVGAQPAVNVVPSIPMPYMGAAFAIEPRTVLAGMRLTTQHNLVSSGTQTQIAGWSADPDSTVTSDRLVIPVTKTGALVEVFLRYQTNSAVGTPSLQWRLLKNAAATQLASQTVSGGGVGTNYEVVMTYTGNFVAGDYLYLTCAGTFTAPAPFVIPGVDTFVRVT